jgi:hypothetical protein
MNAAIIKSYLSFALFVIKNHSALGTCNVKGKGHPITGHEGPRGGVEV